LNKGIFKIQNFIEVRDKIMGARRIRPILFKGSMIKSNYNDKINTYYIMIR